MGTNKTHSTVTVTMIAIVVLRKTLFGNANIVFMSLTPLPILLDNPAF